MNKNKKQPTVAQGAGVAKNDDVKSVGAVVSIAPKKTLEELEKENSVLKQKLQAIPEDFDERVLYFQQKRELIKQLDKLTTSRDRILMVTEQLDQELEEDEFLSPSFSVRVTKKPNYGSEEDVFKLHSPTIIKELIEFVTAKIELKREELKISIEN